MVQIDNPRFYRTVGIATGLIITLFAGRGIMNYISNLSAKAKSAEKYATEANEWKSRFQDLLVNPQKYGMVVDDEFWPFELGGDISIGSVGYGDEARFHPSPYYHGEKMTRHPDVDFEIAVDHSADIQRVVVRRGNDIQDVSRLATIEPVSSEARDGTSGSRSSIIRLDDVQLERGDNIISLHIRQADGGSAHTESRWFTYIEDMQHARQYVNGRNAYIVVTEPGESTEEAWKREMQETLEKMEAMFTQNKN